MFKSRKYINFGSIVSILLVLAIVIFQIYNYFFLTVKTEYAVEASMEDTLDIKGILCRNEKTLKLAASGYCDIVLGDGEKVAKGGIIANVYADESDVKAKEQIRLLSARIEEYNQAIASRASYTGDSSAYEQSIQLALSDYSGALSVGDAFLAQQSLSDFEKNVLIKEIVTGTAVNYEQEIMALRQEISTLESAISGSVSSLRSDFSGFYSRFVDGLEEQITPEKMANFTLEQYTTLYDEISEKEAYGAQNAGKIISEYQWEYFFSLPMTAAKDYKVGKTLRFRFPSVTEQVISGTVVSVKKEGENALIGVRCGAAYSDFFSARILEGQLITKTYRGIRVDKNAVRLIDGESGVYVKVGEIVKFKKADILYQGTTSALLSLEGKVVSFDEVIIGGKNLYDGKGLS